MMEVLVAHPGTQHSHRLAAQLHRHRALHRFWTGFALAEDRRLSRLAISMLPRTIRQRFDNRLVIGIPRSRLRSLPLLDLRALWRYRNGTTEQLLLHERNLRFQEAIPSREIERATAIVGFDTSSWILIERARDIGRPIVLDRSICHPLTQQEAFSVARRRFPDWSDQFTGREAVVLECEAMEHMMAARIIVASGYARKSLIDHGVSPDKIRVNPYGVDLEGFHPSASARANRPLRFIFVGSVSARKGVPLLLQAWTALSPEDAELWCVGPISDSVRSLVRPVAGLKLLGKRSHAQLPDLLRECDVLVLPSYSEGFGLVLLEAMACGLPVITTSATAGPDLIEN